MHPWSRMDFGALLIGKNGSRKMGGLPALENPALEIMAECSFSWARFLPESCRTPTPPSFLSTSLGLF